MYQLMCYCAVERVQACTAGEHSTLLHRRRHWSRGPRKTWSSRRPYALHPSVRQRTAPQAVATRCVRAIDPLLLACQAAVRLHPCMARHCSQPWKKRPVLVLGPSPRSPGKS